MSNERTDRLALMLRLTDMPDPDNVLSWQVDGRAPSAEEVRLLSRLTAEDARDVTALMALDIELTQASHEERWGWGS